MHIFPGHTAVASLYLSTDRAVDPRLLTAAQKIDAEIFAKAKRFALTRPRRIRLKRPIAVALMAHAIVSIAGSHGAVTLDDFRRLGLDDQQIEDCRSDAYQLAVAEKPSLVGIIGEAA